MATTMQQSGQTQPYIQGDPGFETILALPRGARSMAIEESSVGCDCYDCENCDINCEVCDSQ